LGGDVDTAGVCARLRDTETEAETGTETECRVLTWHMLRRKSTTDYHITALY